MVKVNQKDDTFEILFDDGERHQNVKRSEMVKTLEQLSSVLDTTAPTQQHRFKVGDKVSCKIAGWSKYYDGIVTVVHSQGYSVDFADGDKVSVVREKEMISNMSESDLMKPVLLPQYVKVKARIECKFTGWNKYYAGVVKEISPDLYSCTVQFDDGETKSGITADMVRMSKTKSVHQIQFIEEEDEDDLKEENVQHKFALQTRVMANPHGVWTKAFPGRIEHLLTNGTYGILFDDNERVGGVAEQDITLENISAKLNQGPSMEQEDENYYTVGQNIEAKVGLWRKYYPGVITKANAEDGTFMITFLDGEVVNSVKQSEMRMPRLRPDANNDMLEEFDPTTAYKLGERVAAKIHGWKNFWGGYVIEVNEQEKTFKVEFDDGEMYYVFPEDMMRPLPGSSLYKPVLKPVQSVAASLANKTTQKKKESYVDTFDVGERVECRIEDWTRYYPGLVERAHGDGTYAIQFDDMERVVSVKANEMRKMPTVRTARFSVDDDADEEEQRPVI